jgi:hypothetical protein
MVDLFLRLARNLERDRLVEFELRAAVEGGKRLALDLDSTVITEPSGRPWISKPFLP